MSFLSPFIKLILLAVATMHVAAWYLAPGSLTLPGTLKIEGTITREIGKRAEYLRIDTGSQVYRSRCTRAEALCALASEAPGTSIHAHVLTSSFLRDDWIAQADAGGTPVLTFEQQRLLFIPYQRQLVWNAAVSALVAVAAFFLLRKRGRRRSSSA
ncbi:MAG: hypothetical protein IPK97_16695 [Ahniella sp.]|nr:hypothetical protein [Ahniella sp.]